MHWPERFIILIIHCFPNMEGIWKTADNLGMNTLLIPVSWDIMELADSRAFTAFMGFLKVFGGNDASAIYDLRKD